MVQAFSKPFQVDQNCCNALTIVDRHRKAICEVMSGDELCAEDHAAAGLIVAALNAFNSEPVSATKERAT